jgi:hypothetical protein
MIRFDIGLILSGATYAYEIVIPKDFSHEESAFLEGTADSSWLKPLGMTTIGL